MLKRLALIAVMVTGMAVSVQAENYVFDRAHSYIGFAVTHFGLSRVKGNFSDFNGTINYDPANPAKSMVEVTVQAASIDTKAESRDKHLKSPDFFAVDSFPTLTFKSTSITPKNEKSFEVTGDLTMRGVTKPVTLNVELVGAMEDPMMGKRLGFTASGRINRQDFGVAWNKTLDAGGLVVSNEVDLVLEVEAVVPKEKQ
ncbi:MAG TPA: YceI family protein [bacterium]|nr:YceI family protein [bacterium]